MKTETRSPTIYRFETKTGTRGTVWLRPAPRRSRFSTIFQAKSDPSDRYLFPDSCEGYLGGLSYPARDKEHSEEELVKDALWAHSIQCIERWDVVLLTKPKFAEGQYYPHIHRQPESPSPRRTYGREYTDNIVAFTNLTLRLEDLFRQIEPVPANNLAFGHATREILILACTEVEVLCRQVLKANNYLSDSPKRRLSTNDYVKLKGPLLLDQWGVGLENYPEYPTIKPFLDWSSDTPTKSLKFYSSYNAVKHSRDESFSQATFESAITAVAGVFVLLASQFGYCLNEINLGSSREILNFRNLPTYQLEDAYIPPDEGKWEPVAYDFS